MFGYNNGAVETIYYNLFDTINKVFEGIFDGILYNGNESA